MDIPGKRPVNANGLDDLVKNFLSWQQYTTEFASINHALLDQVAEKERQLKESEERYCAVKQEKKGLQDVVDQLQDILKKRCDLEEVNMKLIDEISSMKVSMQESQEKNCLEVSELKRNTEDLQLAHNAELTDLKESLRIEYFNQREILEGTNNEQMAQIQNLQEQCLAAERDKQAQIAKLRLEYDNKLLKLQTQSSRNQQKTSQGGAANQDIFRKKLQHQREESDREIESLKKRISELESQKTTDHSQTNVKRKRGNNFQRS